MIVHFKLEHCYSPLVTSDCFKGTEASEILHGLWSMPSWDDDYMFTEEFLVALDFPYLEEDYPAYYYEELRQYLDALHAPLTHHMSIR